MKKNILIIMLFFIFNYSKAQNFSYGAILGYNGYDVEVDGPIYAGNGFSGLNFGGFVEYKINHSFGVRGNLIYSNLHEGKYAILNGNQLIGTLFEKSEIKSIQFHTLLKFDVDRRYDKGFYLIGGFRLTNNVDVKIDGNTNDSFYRKMNLGGMFGFGLNFAKYFGLELIPEVNLTNTIDSEINKSENYGAYLNLTVNIEEMLKK